MKFLKGFVVGGIITTGVFIMCNDSKMMNKNKMVKMGRQFAKKIGII